MPPARVYFDENLFFSFIIHAVIKHVVKCGHIPQGGHQAEIRLITGIRFVAKSHTDSRRLLK